LRTLPAKAVDLVVPAADPDVVAAAEVAEERQETLDAVAVSAVVLATEVGMVAVLEAAMDSAVHLATHRLQPTVAQDMARMATPLEVPTRVRGGRERA
jgi:hypothetical protein